MHAIRLGNLFRVFGNLNNWLAKSITHRAVFSSVLFSLSLIFFLGMTATPVIYYQVNEALERDNGYQAARIQEQIKYRFDTVLESIETLARNSFVVNAFVDSSGREIYLQPLLRDFRLPFDIETKIVVIDMNLNPIASNVYQDLSEYPKLPIVIRALQADYPGFSVSISGQQLFFASPVFFPPASLNVGVVLLEIQLRPFLIGPQEFLVGPQEIVDKDLCHLVKITERILYQSPCNQDFWNDENDRGTLKLIGYSITGEPLNILFENHKHSILFSIGKILLSYIVLAIISGLFAQFIARCQIRRLTQPLVDLSNMAQMIASNPESNAIAPVVGRDEIAYLAMSFNKMLSELRRLKTSLENRVLEKTRELMESEERFRNMANAAPVSIWIAGVDRSCNWFNQTWLDFTGRTMEQEIGNGWVEDIHPDDLEYRLEIYQNCFNQRKVFRLEYRLRRHDGEYRWVLESGLPLFDRNHNFTGYIGSCIDIHDRRVEEEKLRVLSTVVEQSPSSIVISDLKGKIQYVNPKFVEVTGYSLEEVLGKNPRILQSGLTSKAIFLELWDSVTKGHVWHGEFLNKRKNGDLYWEDVHIAPVIDPAGIATHYVGIKNEITTRKKIEQELIATRDAANASAKAKAEFLANMSHEIRTPMNAIIGFSVLALDKPLSPELRDYLEKIHLSSDSLLRILNDILDYSKIEAGRMTIEKNRFDLGLLLNALRNLFALRAEEKALDFQIDIAQEVPRQLFGDELRLQQILSNLLGNAIKFTEHGQVTLQVTVQAVEDAKTRIGFMVKDTGIGMDTKTVAHLFQAFTQADTSISRRFGGTGLGLAISRELLLLMGSDFLVESTPGRGSAFSFELSLDISTDTQQQAFDNQPQSRMQTQSLTQALREYRRYLQGTRILVAEDNAINQQVIRKLLQRFGVVVKIANDGQEALDRLIQEDFDAILMDVHMPEMDGLAATQRIRQMERFMALPVIALTAGVTTKEQEEARACGMSDFLAKPVNPHDLAVTLLRWIPSRKTMVMRSAPIKERDEMGGRDSTATGWNENDS
ncbi:MAG: PAS domain S-box protein [Gammaproteobacteria bacterium]|nr:PAS domain S-box protein [Gammaproteobacteria bacterium]MCP5196739.1 PAS domain S-box protein [Gammaproteobacteria bacterium]